MCPPPPMCAGSGSKSATGLMEWSEADGAMDAFVMANHQTIYSSSKLTYKSLPVTLVSLSLPLTLLPTPIPLSVPLPPSLLSVSLPHSYSSLCPSPSLTPIHLSVPSVPHSCSSTLPHSYSSHPHSLSLSAQVAKPTPSRWPSPTTRH